jgi:hypothetical protein
MRSRRGPGAPDASSRATSAADSKRRIRALRQISAQRRCTAADARSPALTPPSLTQYRIDERVEVVLLAVTLVRSWDGPSRRDPGVRVDPHSGATSR